MDALLEVDPRILGFKTSPVQDEGDLFGSPVTVQQLMGELGAFDLKMRSIFRVSRWVAPVLTSLHLLQCNRRRKPFVHRNAAVQGEGYFERSRAAICASGFP
jgi:hypothetical protein